MSTIRIGVIGYGGRARYLAQLIVSQYPDVRLVAIADPRHEAIRQELVEAERDLSEIALYENADEMLDRESLDGVVVGTRCSQHAAMGVKVLNRGIPLFLEKPVATNIDDLMALHDSMTDKVVVCHPLRVSTIVNLAREIIDSGKIGTVEHVQAWNNVPYGAVYFQSWYRDEKETGGLFLQKATHDFDYINSLLGDNQPRTICAMTSKQIFKGNHSAGLKCTDCDERRTCYESPYHPSRPNALPLHQPAGDMCSFAVDTGNEDSGSAVVQYESGMHMVYSQNFFARNKAEKRGARFLGYHGTLEFDWYVGALKVFMHHASRVETYEFSGGDGHGGGDQVLVANFIDVMKGEAVSMSPLEAGITSALMCLKAKESAETHTFQELVLPTATGTPHGKDLVQANGRHLS
jgi:predicted dehydrogenase